jgi:hypothetical protein
MPTTYAPIAATCPCCGALDQFEDHGNLAPMWVLVPGCDCTPAEVRAALHPKRPTLVTFAPAVSTADLLEF